MAHAHYLSSSFLSSSFAPLPCSRISTLIWTRPAIAFHNVSSYLSQMQQECQGERGSAGVSEGLMKNYWQRVEGGMSLMEGRGKNKTNFLLQGCHQRRIIYTETDLYHLLQYAEPKIKASITLQDTRLKTDRSSQSAI